MSLTMTDEDNAKVRAAREALSKTPATTGKLLALALEHAKASSDVDRLRGREAEAHEGRIRLRKSTAWANRIFNAESARERTQTILIAAVRSILHDGRPRPVPVERGAGCPRGKQPAWSVLSTETEWLVAGRTIVGVTPFGNLRLDDGTIVSPQSSWDESEPRVELGHYRAPVGKKKKTKA